MLNGLGVGGRAAGRAAPRTASACQLKAIRRLASCYAEAPVTDDIFDPVGAWTALQGMHSGYTDTGLAVANDRRSF